MTTGFLYAADEDMPLGGDDGWGSHYISLVRQGAGDYCGRSEFFIHNSSEPGSAGCVDFAMAVDQWPFWYELAEDALEKKRRNIPVYVY